MCVSRPTCWNPKSRTPGTCHATGRLDLFGLACLSDISSGKKLAASRGDALMEAHCMNEPMNSDCCSCRTMQLWYPVEVDAWGYALKLVPRTQVVIRPACAEEITLPGVSISRQLHTYHSPAGFYHRRLRPSMTIWINSVFYWCRTTFYLPRRPRLPPMQCGGYLPCPHTTCMWSGAGLAALYSRGQARTQPRTHHFMPQHGTIHT